MSWEEKRKLVFARLDAKSRARETIREARVGDEERTATAVDAFWAATNADCIELRKEFDAVAESGAVPSGAKSGKALVDDWARRVGLVRTRAADASGILPPYDAEQAQLTVAALERDFGAAKSVVLPRKRFAFRRRKKEKGKGEGGEREERKETMEDKTGGEASGGGEGGSGGLLDALEKEIEAGERTVRGHVDKVVVVRVEGEGVEDESGVFVVENVEDGGDLRLMDCRGCVVVVEAGTRALRVDGLRDCVVFAMPISGSVILHDCQGCKFFFAARQLRLHTSILCTFFIRSASRPIIEHCEKLSFAPYMLSHPSIVEALDTAGLSPKTNAEVPSLWARVDDFGWHRVHRSPHFHILPPDQRPTSLHTLFHSPTPSPTTPLATKYLQDASFSIAIPADLQPYTDPEEAPPLYTPLWTTPAAASGKEGGGEVGGGGEEEEEEEEDDDEL